MGDTSLQTAELTEQVLLPELQVCNTFQTVLFSVFQAKSQGILHLLSSKTA